jgi:hypothetical protein
MTMDNELVLLDVDADGVATFTLNEPAHSVLSAAQEYQRRSSGRRRCRQFSREASKVLPSIFIPKRSVC